VLSYSSDTHARTTNPPDGAQLEGTSTIPPSYIRVRAVVWECGEGQTDRQTHRQTHRQPWPLHISPRLCHTRNVTIVYLNVFATVNWCCASPNAVSLQSPRCGRVFTVRTGTARDQQCFVITRERKRDTSRRFQLTLVTSVHLKIRINVIHEIYEIQQICEIHLTK